MSDPFVELRKSTFGTHSPSISLIRLRSSYGTIPISGPLKERHDQIFQEFSVLSSPISFKEILGFLSERQLSKFDESLCQELFAKMDKEIDALLTTSEFVSSYVDAEYMIMKRIRELRKLIKDNKKNVEEYNVKLKEARNKEQLNQFGLMKDSQLSVNVIGAQDLYATDESGNSDPYVILEYENQRFMTKHVSGSLNPN